MHHRFQSALVFFFAILFAISISPDARAATDSSFLKTDGRTLRDQRGKGKVVQLRGTNLGGWLVTEDWMCPWNTKKETDDFTGRKILIDRFGDDVADRLIDVYEDTWITSADLDNINQLGLNTVRVPFWYRNLQSETGQWRADAFKRLDWIVAEAGKRKLYVILDLHGVPGGQSQDHTTGRARNLKKTSIGSTFWINKDEQRRTLDIWRKVAAHFRGNPSVAAYDLLNEPIAAPSRSALWSVYDRLYREVRRVDPDHIITIEGCWSGQGVNWEWNVLPPPTKFGWTNIIYQMHSYDFANWNNAGKQIANNEKQLADFQKHLDWNVPAYIGEFNPMAQPTAWSNALNNFDHAGIAWTTWTYKVAGRSMTGPTNSWGLYNPKEPRPPVPNLESDTAEVIEQKWRSWTTSSAFAINPLIREALVPTDK